MAQAAQTRLGGASRSAAEREGCCCARQRLASRFVVAACAPEACRWRRRAHWLMIHQCGSPRVAQRVVTIGDTVHGDSHIRSAVQKTDWHLCRSSKPSAAPRPTVEHLMYYMAGTARRRVHQTPCGLLRIVLRCAQSDCYQSEGLLCPQDIARTLMAGAIMGHDHAAYYNAAGHWRRCWREVL